MLDSLSVPVGIPLTGYAPDGPGRTLISGSGFFSQMNRGQTCRLSAHSPTHGTRAVPRCVGYVSDERVSSVSRSLPSSLTADDGPFLFE
jgi:hypothetical protein